MNIIQLIKRVFSKGETVTADANEPTLVVFQRDYDTVIAFVTEPDNGTGRTRIAFLDQFSMRFVEMWADNRRLALYTEMVGA